MEPPQIPKMVGGRALVDADADNRILEFRGENLQAGDIIAVARNITPDEIVTEQYLCLGGVYNEAAGNT